MEEEWQRYEQLLLLLRDNAGIPLSSIVDVRGNHDGFNRAPRGSAQDYFTHYSATGRVLKDPFKRVWSHFLLPPAGNDFDEQEESSSSTLGKTPGAISNSSAVNRSLIGLEEWKMRFKTEDDKSINSSFCPAAVLLGIDFAEDPGFKNPLNFLGHSNESLEAAIVAEMDEIKSSWPKECLFSPAVVAYGHYPLSSVDHHHGDSSTAIQGPLDHIRHALRPIQSMQGATLTLAQAGIGSYLSGHLHTVFGERLHRAHPIINLNNSDNDKKPESSVENGLRNSHNHQYVFNELETGAWKDDRRLRIAAIDQGALSFIDLYMHTPTSALKPTRIDAQQRSNSEWLQRYNLRNWGLSVVDPYGVVIDHIALMTWPIDARYSPQPNVRADAYPRGTVRALVFSLDGKEEESSADAEEVDVEVQIFLPSGALLFEAPLSPVGEINSNSNNSKNSRGPVLFAGSPTVLVDCKGGDIISNGIGKKVGNTSLVNGGTRVSVDAACTPPATFVDVIISMHNRNSTGSITSSKSGRLPVSLQCTAVVHSDSQHAQQECWLAPSETRAPMNGTWVESFFLYINAPVYLHRSYLVMWLGYVVFFLLLPRALAKDRGIYQRILGSQLRAGLQGQTRENRSNSLSLAVTGTRAAQFALSRFISRIVAAITWPCTALILCAGVTKAWLPMVLYSLYFLIGPLYIAPVNGGRLSLPFSVVFCYGIFGKLDNDHTIWRFHPTSDTLPVAAGQLVVGFIPFTLWVACVVGRAVVASNRKKERLNSSGNQKGTTADKESLMSRYQVLALVAIMIVNYIVMYHKMLIFLGPLSLVLSPGFAWVGPLAMILVVVVVVKDTPCLKFHGWLLNKVN